jgi:hypothetical protein
MTHPRPKLTILGNPITGNNETLMTETNNDWGAAPKNGSEINVQFPDGTKARAKWNAAAQTGGQWEVLRHTGEWVSMRYDHGIHDPDVWWP